MTNESQAGPSPGPVEKYAVDKTRPAGRGDGGALGCLAVGVLVLVAGVGLWLFRNPDWGIPGIVCFAIMAVGWTAVTATWKDAFKAKKRVVCPHCQKGFEIREDITGPVPCPGCAKSSEAP